jgi:hypothetical protein
MAWPQEQIPDSDDVFMRVHESFVKNGEYQPGVFRDHEGGMSTNWQKYCPTAEDSRQKASTPANYGVLQMNVSDIRRGPEIVTHTPLPNDRSHTDVIGNKKLTAERFRLHKLSHWALRI